MEDTSHSPYDHDPLLRASAILSNHRKKWRSTMAAINSSHFMVFLAKEKRSIKSRKRWTFAFAVIRSSYRFMLSILKPETVLDIIPFFDVDPKILAEIVKEKNWESLHQLGGVEGIAAKLKTDVNEGIRGNQEDLFMRREAFGSNTYRNPPVKGFSHFLFQALKHTTIVSSLIYLVFDIREQGPENGAYDSGSLFVAMFLIVAVSAGSNFRQSRQFDKLLKPSDDIEVDVLREGQREKVSISDIVVGDIVCLNSGDQIPADGLFLYGFELHVDEPSIVGRSDNVEVYWSRNPFLLSGTKVVRGNARMLVTAVGENTVWGKTMSSIVHDSAYNDQPSLQAQIDKISSIMERIALAFAIVVLALLLVRYFTGNTEDGNGNPEFKGSKTKVHNVVNKILRFVNAAVSIVVAAVPEGLPLAFTIARVYSVLAMSDKLKVRTLSACETMGLVDCICTENPGMLNSNQMKVTKFWIGEEAMKSGASVAVASNVLKLLREAVGLNTTGSLYRSRPELSGSLIEKTIRSWAVLELCMDMEQLNRNCVILNVKGFDLEKNLSRVLMRKDDNTIDVHWKGDAEIILARCSNYYDCSGIMKSIDEGEKTKIEQIIQLMAVKSFLCIAFAHKQIPGEEMEYNEDGKTHQNGLTWLGIVGLEDPCRTAVREAVEYCRNCGVNIKLITRENVFTARAIAIECGILCSNQDMNNGEEVEAKDFQNWTQDERMEKVDRIRVMALSSLSDKKLMVQCLKQKGRMVAFIGNGTHDAPALKEAHVGLSMDIQGTEVAKESSDIIILNDDFASVAIGLKWGRSVYNNVQKFIQFQLTVNVTTLVINFISAVSDCKIPLTAVHFLLVNLMMATLGAMALATQKPTEVLMVMRPLGCTPRLITNVMYRNIFAQALYQIAILFFLQLKGKSVFNVNEKVKDTLIFNTFFFCQVFNEFNARKLEKKNIFKGIHKNHWFLGIMGLTIILHVVIMEFLRGFVHTKVLDWGQWGACIGIAVISWPICWAVKHIHFSATSAGKGFFWLSLLQKQLL